MNRLEALNLLGLSGNPAEDEIKKAYRKSALKYHPDKNSGSAEAEEKFKQISTAYEILTKPQKSPDFFGSGFSDFDVDDLVQEFVFGRNKRRNNTPPKAPRPGEKPITLPDVDIGTRIITLEQVLFREPYDIKAKVQACCKKCLGNVSIWSPCNRCNQTGYIQQVVRTPLGKMATTNHCRTCNGVGWKSNTHCKDCKDKLIYVKEKTISIRLPKDFKTGQKIRVPFSGNENWNTKDGSIYVQFKLDIPDLSLLTKEKKGLLKSLLTK